MGVWLVCDQETVLEYAGIVHPLVVGLLDEAIRVTVIAPDPARDLCDLAPVSVVCAPSTSLWLSGRRLRSLAASLGEKARLIHCLSPAAGDLGVRLARQVNLPYVISFTELLQALPRHLLDADLCAGLIGHHPQVAEQLRALVGPEFAAMVRHAPIGVHLVDVPLRPHADEPPPTAIIARGPLEPEQGFEQLLDAFFRIVEQRYDALLFLIGAGSLERQLRRNIKQWGITSRVTFVPPLPDAGHIVAGADIYVQPRTTWEIDLATLEAMASGLAVVAAHDSGGIDLVTPERDGLVYAAGSATDLARQLQRLLDDRALVERLSQGARETIRREYLAARMVAAMIEIYREVILRRSTFSIAAAVGGDR